MKLRRAGLFVATLAVAGCGSVNDLEPPEGQSLPPPAYGEEARPTAEQLLEKPSQADPDRNDELLRRSKPREDDEFDLPPGG